MKIAKSIVLSAVLFCGVNAPPLWAATAQSWNLARDMYIATERAAPGSPWSFMQNKTAQSLSANYTPLPTFVADTCNGANVTCWRDASTGAYINIIKKSFTFTGSGGSFVFKQGDVVTHPGSNSETIVRWTSPIHGSINVLGRINDLHDACGDGISWTLNLGDVPIQSGNLPNGGSSVIKAANVGVDQGSAIYLAINKKADHSCDATSLDLMITN
ncbi:hypothetical protein Q7C30_020035 [Pseudomonas sp. RAC1]|uniref:hypothetical protein n=1 Tax=Pseudomonas sp. RAC1 TaxID=3064900 RepID=UPI002727E371|nr:hypothetical protein [Pseudomonas sp. RAC1]MDV9034387.1 hypothetical protein [Pseudomonas sp. RAC1]